jgi:hypothetical protein
MTWFGLPVYETLVPICVWGTILIHHAWMLQGDIFSLNQHIGGTASVYSFFAQTRIGWVKQNHLTGQASANSTRDYLRVLIFYAGNAITLSTLVAGYCVSNYDVDGTPTAHMVTVKLAVISVIFLVIFLIMVYAVRYGTHFHMMMNVKHINGLPVANHLRIIEIVYHKAHFFFSTGQRLHFILVPAFAWMVHTWALVGALPVYLFLIKQYDSVEWMQDDIDALIEKGTTSSTDAKTVAEQEMPLLGGLDSSAKTPAEAVALQAVDAALNNKV